MKQVLFISFDLIRPGEVSKPLAIATMLSYLKNDEQLKDQIAFHHLSINFLKYGGGATPSDFDDQLLVYDFDNIDYVAISAYVWNEYILNGFINHIRLLGFKGAVILGGYQVTYADKKLLPILYPDVQVFISGYAEQALKELFTSIRIEAPIFLNSPVDFSQLPSVYLSNEIEVPSHTPMLRLETKRGCPYRCSFCAHRDLTKNKVYKHPLDKIFAEVSLFKDRNVARVNILDPIFNAGKDCLAIMGEINRINSVSTYTLQCRFENIKGAPGEEFLDLCQSDTYHLEFGLQTADVYESEIINRKNNIRQVEEVLLKIKERDISYEVSLIYGLPGQSIDSFKRSIDFVASRGCKIIKAYPLMLLRGTELYNEKERWGIKEESLGEFQIPVVTSSNSFTRDEWDIMNMIANDLTCHYRY